MSRSTEWFEYHLTRRGWVEGSEQLDFGNVDRPVPKGRVLTVRWHDYLSSVYSKPDRWSTIEWEDHDCESTRSLKQKFGGLPPGSERYPVRR